MLVLGTRSRSAIMIHLPLSSVAAKTEQPTKCLIWEGMTWSVLSARHVKIITDSRRNERIPALGDTLHDRGASQHSAFRDL